MRDASGVKWFAAGLHGSARLTVDDATGHVSRERYLPHGNGTPSLAECAGGLPFSKNGRPPVTVGDLRLTGRMDPHGVHVRSHRATECLGSILSPSGRLFALL